MLPEIVKYIRVDLEMLTKLKNDFEQLCIKSKNEIPGIIEITALAGMLHSFYGGVENIFEHIAKNVDNEIPEGPFWHQSLLEQMTLQNNSRPPLVSKELESVLHLYMNFRHVFRHAYAIELKWKKMESLVVAFPMNFSLFKAEIELFLSFIEKS